MFYLILRWLCACSKMQLHEFHKCTTDVNFHFFNHVAYLLTCFKLCVDFDNVHRHSDSHIHITRRLDHSDAVLCLQLHAVLVWSAISWAICTGNIISSYYISCILASPEINNYYYIITRCWNQWISELPMSITF